MSSIVYPDIFVCMETGIATFIRARRKELGLSQTALAEKVGVTQGYMSQLEKGNIALPSADLRRRLAIGLGVSHLEILVATGELLPDEAQIPEDPRSDAVRRLSPLIDAIDWDSDPSRIRLAEFQLKNFLDLDRERNERG